jgi:hypothetical protein
MPMHPVDDAEMIAQQNRALAWQLGWELHRCARLQQRNDLQQLLKAGGAYCGAPDVFPALNWRDENGTSALWWVCVHGDCELVRLLLEAGADPNCADKDSWTPVSLVARCGHEDCLELLIHAGAELSVPVSDGDTALEGRLLGECRMRAVAARAWGCAIEAFAHPYSSRTTCSPPAHSLDSHIHTARRTITVRTPD